MRRFLSYSCRSLLWLTTLSCGCHSNRTEHTPIASALGALVDAPLYIVDGVSDKTHRRTFLLTNQSSKERAFTFAGKTCGCLVCEYKGKVLAKGDEIRVLAHGAEEITLTNRLAYLDGFYSNSAFFMTDDVPAQRLAFDSSYAVVKNLIVSPSAFMFERSGENDSFKASASAKFRRLGDVNARLKIVHLPAGMRWNQKCKAKGAEMSLANGAKPFYEDEWELELKVDADAESAGKLPLDGWVRISVQDEQSKELTALTLAYNAERLGTARDSQHAQSDADAHKLSSR